MHTHEPLYALNGMPEAYAAQQGVASSAGMDVWPIPQQEVTIVAGPFMRFAAL